MTRFIALLFAAFLAVPANAAPTFFWRAEGTALDGTHDFSAGDTSASAVNSVAIDAAAARVGSNGIVFNAANERYVFDVASLLASPPTTGAIGYWIQWPTALAAGGAFHGAFIRDATNGGDFIVVSRLGADELRFTLDHTTNAAANLDTTAANLASGNWYFVLVRWNSSINYREIAVYDNSMALIQSVVDSSTDFSTSVPSQLTGSGGVRFGDSGGTATEAWMDNIFLAITYNEPIEDNALITSYTGYGAGGGVVVVNSFGGINQGGSAARPISSF